jgi:hypothetical protein
LQILEPDNNLVVRTSRVRVTGVTDQETGVLINNQRISVDDRGNFSEQIDLQNGVNYIKIVAVNKRGHQSSLARQVIYNPTD